MKPKPHTISVGFHQIYNVQLHAQTPEAAVEKLEALIKSIGLHDTLLFLDAIECPICNDQTPFIQYEWSD